jgi:sortase A
MIPRLRFRWLQRGFLVLGLLLLALWSQTNFDSRRFQAAESKKLEAALREVEAAPSAAVPSIAALVGPLSSDAPKHAAGQEGVLGRIEIPRLRIRAIVAEGVDTKTLGRAVGHITSTALPGTPGNCALAGHRDTFLRGLGGVRVNDIIRIVTLERTYKYQVEWSAVVEPRRLDVLNATAKRSLTLVTCYPFAFVGHAPQRFVVRARQVEAVAGSTAIEDRAAFQPQGLTAERR